MILLIDRQLEDSASTNRINLIFIQWLKLKNSLKKNKNSKKMNNFLPKFSKNSHSLKNTTLHRKNYQLLNKNKRK